MVSLFYQDYGSAIKLFIHGDSKEEIEEAHYSLYNHKGTDTKELFWEDVDSLASVWSTPESLKHAITQSCLFLILNEDLSKFKGKKGGVYKEACKMAEERMSKIQKINDINQYKSYYFFYSSSLKLDNF